jgi:hypothetical protein
LSGFPDFTKIVKDIMGIRYVHAPNTMDRQVPPFPNPLEITEAEILWMGE